MCTSVLGFNLSLPIMLGPLGIATDASGGEVAAGGGQGGLGYILSTISGHKLKMCGCVDRTGFLSAYLMAARGGRGCD